MEQDAAFGLQQLVDGALEALSPGINDPTTACMCIDRLGALLGRLASRRFPDPHRMARRRLRVIALAPNFTAIVKLALDPIVAHSRGDLQVLGRMLDALGFVAQATLDPQRHASLDKPLLTQRAVVYAAAREKHPHRWTGASRDWTAIAEVHLNPTTPKNKEAKSDLKAA